MAVENIQTFAAETAGHHGHRGLLQGGRHGGDVNRVGRTNFEVDDVAHFLRQVHEADGSLFVGHDVAADVWILAGYGTANVCRWTDVETLRDSIFSSHVTPLACGSFPC